MHGYETKELREAHLDALAAEKTSAEQRLAHAEEAIASGASGPDLAYHERVAEQARATIAGTTDQLRVFSGQARPKRGSGSKRGK